MNPRTRRKRKRARRPFHLHVGVSLLCGCHFSVASHQRGTTLVKYMRRCSPGCSARTFGGTVTREEDDWTFEVTLTGVPQRKIRPPLGQYRRDLLAQGDKLLNLLAKD